MPLLSANFLLFSVIFHFFCNIHRYFLVKFSYCNAPLLHHARISVPLLLGAITIGNYLWKVSQLSLSYRKYLSLFNIQ